MSEIIQPVAPIVPADSPRLVVKLKDGSDFTMYVPTEKQLEFHTNPSKKLLAYGNRGGGKSILLRFDAHMRALASPGANLVLVRKSYKDLIKNHVFFQGLPWGSLKKEMQLLGGDFNKTDYICHYPNGSKLFLSYVGDESDTMNLLGAEFMAAYFDEISTIPWDFFTKLSASVRVAAGSGRHSVIRAATNPFGESAGDVMRYFVWKDVDPEEDADYRPKDWDSIKINTQDNPYQDPNYLNELRGLNLPEHIKKAWIEGEYFEETALFSFRATRDEKPYHVIKEFPLEKVVNKVPIYRVYDHGYKPDPAYCAWIAHLGNRYVVFHEKVWYETVAQDIAASMKEEDRKLGIDRIYATYCDPTIDIKTGQDYRTIKDIFEEHGVPMDCSINNREQFAGVIHSALADEVEPGVPKLQVYSTGRLGAPYLVRALPMMRYNPKKPSALADHKHDHPVVALAYFLISHSSWDRKEMKPVKIKPWMKPAQEGSWVLGQKNSRDRN